MDREMFRKALSNALPYADRPKRISGGSSRIRRKNTDHKRSRTTIFAFRYADGIMACGDRKTSGWGYDVISLGAVKVSPVGPRSVLSFSGSVGSGQMLIHQIQEENRSFFERTGFPLSIPGQARFLANFCREYRESSYLDLGVDIILSGRDWDETFYIYSIEEDGSALAFKNYYVSGSGTYNARTILDSQWEPKLSFKDALHLAMEAQYQAGLRDSGTSHLAIATPNVVIITEKEFREVDSAKVEKARQKVLRGKKEVINERE